MVAVDGGTYLKRQFPSPIVLCAYKPIILSCDGRGRRENEVSSCHELLNDALARRSIVPKTLPLGWEEEGGRHTHRALTHLGSKLSLRPRRVGRSEQSRTMGPRLLAAWGGGRTRGRDGREGGEVRMELATSTDGRTPASRPTELSTHSPPGTALFGWRTVFPITD